MDYNKLTQKSREALGEAETRAMSLGHSEVDLEHLTSALLEQEGGLLPRILKSMDLDPIVLDREVSALVARKPKVSA